MAYDEVVIHLERDEVAMLLEALDALEYWQLGDVLPRNDGMVFIPGDMAPGEDRYWTPDRQASPAEAEAIEQVRRCRALADQLRSAEHPEVSEQ